MIFLWLAFAATTFAAQNYLAERIPPSPEVKKQFRLILRTPGVSCKSWKKVSPLLDKEDLLVNESKRDYEGDPGGCRFLWVINPAQTPAAMRFELEPSGGGKEYFEVPAASPAANTSVLQGGIADEDGTGLVNINRKSGLKLPSAPAMPATESKSADPSTGK